METTLARGVLRSYRTHTERLVALQGRLDVGGQVTRAGVAVPVACIYDDYTPDTAARADDLDRVTITRLNAYYEPALRLARLLLANLALVDQRGETAASSFLVDMNKLFERVVNARLRRALRDRLEVRAEPPVHLAQGRQVRMKPDLEFRRKGTPVYVGDVKYKLTASARARNPDYYQLLAYTTALDLPEGVLIYCLADGGRLERSITVRHAGKVLHTYAIDLSGPVNEVAAQIEALASWIAERANRTPVWVAAAASTYGVPLT